MQEPDKAASSEAPAESTSMLLRYSFLEKLKAGLGAAGLAAVISEAAVLPALARFVGFSIPAVGTLGNYLVIVIAAVAFFAAALASRTGEHELEKKMNSSNKRMK